MSRQHYPKQFLPLTGRRTMFQETLLRLDGIEGAAPPIVVSNEEHRFLALAQARQEGIDLSSLILEPVGRNTAPALSLAALALLDDKEGEDPDPVMLVSPADHLIREPEAFRAAARAGESLARCGRLVMFGIVPTGAVTGYGYLRMGQAIEPSADGSEAEPSRVSAFVEKPDEKAAQAYVDSGGYLWNSGIFMVRASVWLRELGHYRPDISKACRIAYSRGRRDGKFYRPDEQAFVACPSDSIDYAVMERAADAKNSPAGDGESADCVVLALDAGWSDLGSWSSVWEEGDADRSGNVVLGDVHMQAVDDSLLISNHRLLAAVGLSNVIVVETSDAVLVARKDSAQEVRDLVSQLETDRRPEYEDHREVHRPWGSYDVLDTGDGFKVKRIKIDPGAALSLQKHQHRGEHWVVVRGTARITRGSELFLLTENQSAYVPKQVTHRLENPGKETLEIIEVQLGGYLGEDDIERFDDRYDRQDPP